MRAIILFISLLALVSALVYPERPEGQGWRLLRTSYNYAEWVHEEAIDHLRFGTPSKGYHVSAQVRKAILETARFKDVTQEYEDGIRVSKPVPLALKTIPDYPKPDASAHPEVVEILKKASPSQLETDLKALSSLHTRYYQSSYSTQSPKWISARVNKIVTDNKASDVKVDFIKNANFDQPNVRAIVPAQDGSTNAEEIVILGGHLDSVCNVCDGKDARSPGADDDGSGSVTVIEVFRLIVENKWRGSRPIHFMWFAAEEGGLLGSSTVAKMYKQANKNVYGMLQFDMTGEVSWRFRRKFGEL